MFCRFKYKSHFVSTYLLKVDSKDSCPNLYINHSRLLIPDKVHVILYAESALKRGALV